MFIYNIKINGSKTFKTFFAIVTIFIIIVLGIVVYKIFNGAKNSFNLLDVCLKIMLQD